MLNVLMNNTEVHLSVKSVCFRSFPCPYFSAFGLNTDQKISEYGHVSHSQSIIGNFIASRISYHNNYSYFLNGIQTDVDSTSLSTSATTPCRDSFPPDEFSVVKNEYQIICMM